MVHIKTICIMGFKSYRDQTQMEPFSSSHNVVVGRNGSGKSNFFAAIRFVLSDQYTSMSREERQALLHEGVRTTSTLVAWVEIVFDNSDGRFPTGKDEVIIRRTIGQKKDEYSLDKKTSSKADVMNLLESAGFSKSNPYYIVPQGRITSLTNAKDHERLALLKEVAGTKVYEQRRAESLKIMDDTAAKRAKITDLLQYIEERLTELEEEKEELKEFQEKDKERRCLEYALYQKELEEVGAALEEVEEERRQDIHNSNTKRTAFEAREKVIEELEVEISQARQQKSVLTLSKHGLDGEMSELIRARTEIACIVADLQAAGAQGKEQKALLEDQLQAVLKQITEQEASLMELEPDWTAAKAEERDEKKQLDDANARLSVLYSKQGRMSQFRTKADRDKYLKREITAIQEFEVGQLKSVETTKAAIDATKNLSEEIAQKAEEVSDKLNNRGTRLATLSDELNVLKERHTELTEQRKDLWREETKLTSTVDHARDELRTAERNLASMMDKDTGNGLRAVDRIAERLQLDGVYGPLYRLFNVRDRNYNTAVELTAGASLFHVVVDNDNTASRVLEVMTKEKTGRITFMPLNRLKPKKVPFPQTSDVQPLIEKLEFAPAHAKAFEQVFGKTCVCKDLTIAAAYARSHNLNTITIGGDKADRKGALTGGYHDIRRSRIDGIKAIKTWNEKHQSESARLTEVKDTIRRLEQEITFIVGQMQVLNGQRSQAQTSREPLAAEATGLQREQLRLEEQLNKLESDVSDLEADLTGLTAKREGLSAELRTPMANALTPDETAAMDALSKEVDQRKARMVDLGKHRAELTKQKNLIDIELNENLRRRREELRGKIESLGEAVAGNAEVGDLEVRKKELDNLDSSIADLKQRVIETDQEADKLTSEVQKLSTRLDKAQNEQTEDNRGISRQQKNMERYLAKRQMLSGRKDECSSKIRDLGVLPEEAFIKYTHDKTDKIMKKLHGVNEGLKKFKNINRKAFEQYNNFTKQRDQLLQRGDDLDASAQSIQELVEVLDQRKDEAIERTFKQVAKYFSEVFEKLVPVGRGRLIMQRKSDAGQGDEEEEEEEQRRQSTIESYTGVSIKVSFNSKVDEGLRIQQLSGGQKSLVALATVFAIQKCDPAPFYLFDEIDANLDAQYRTAVASMIHELSSTAQFITTTFRPEMLAAANQFYGVLFNNQKVSSIRSITKEEAQEFVEQEAMAQ